MSLNMMTNMIRWRDHVATTLYLYAYIKALKMIKVFFIISIYLLFLV